MQEQDQIAALIETFVKAWNAGDGDACAAPFAPDADFTAVTGLQVSGRDLIARGHREILATVFRGTRIRAAINRIRFVRPDVAIADVTIRFDVQPQAFHVDRAMPGVVAVKGPEGWSIVDFRNLIPFGRPMAGPLEQELSRQPAYIG